MVQIHPEYEVVDDTGLIHRTERTEESEAWEDFDRARLEDVGAWAELQGMPIEPSGEEAETIDADEPEPVLENEPAQVGGGGEAARVYRNLGLAQPVRVRTRRSAKKNGS